VSPLLHDVELHSPPEKGKNTCSASHSCSLFTESLNWHCLILDKIFWQYAKHGIVSFFYYLFLSCHPGSPGYAFWVSRIRILNADLVTATQLNAHPDWNCWWDVLFPVMQRKRAWLLTCTGGCACCAGWWPAPRTTWPGPSTSRPPGADGATNSSSWAPKRVRMTPLSSLLAY
jgi:hypothetical protein